MALRELALIMARFGIDWDTLDPKTKNAIIVIANETLDKAESIARRNNSVCIKCLTALDIARSIHAERIDYRYAPVAGD